MRNTCAARQCGFKEDARTVESRGDQSQSGAQPGTPIETIRHHVPYLARPEDQKHIPTFRRP